MSETTLPSKPTPWTWRDPAPHDHAAFDPRDVFAAGLRNHHIANTAYPIAHQVTWKPYRIARPDHVEVASRGLARGADGGYDDMCLYVHVPFCEVRCSFCEYTVVKRQEHALMGAYVDAMVREVARWDDTVGLKGRRIHGLDVGGGTPSMLPAEDVERVLTAIRERVQFVDGSDISIETTPKIAAADKDKIRAYRAMGIDRISMGIQVIQPDLLKVLNRSENGIEHHTHAVDHIRAAGFDRLNLDLMYGFADQSLESWEATLDHAIGLGPEYITLYRMRYKLTRISDQASRVSLDQVRPMQTMATAKLHEAGYAANPGKTNDAKIDGDVGTSADWRRRVQDGMPDLGIGLGAQTFTHTTISYASGSAGKNLAPYLKDMESEGVLPLQDLYDLPRTQMMGKTCAVSFYFGEIREAPFVEKFGCTLSDAFPDVVDFVISDGLMEWTGEGASRALSLTKRGAASKNGVIPLFAAPSIQQHLIERDPHHDVELERSRKIALRVAG